MKRARELFALERRSVGSPYVHEMWWTRSEPVEAFVSVATSHWVMVVTRQRNATTVTVRGPETRATSVPIPEDAEFIGIQFGLGTYMPFLQPRQLVDRSLTLPQPTGTSFWLDGSVWRVPQPDDVDSFVGRLVRAGVLVHDPIVSAAVAGDVPGLSTRSVERRVSRATGLTRGAVRRIRQAEAAVELLTRGWSASDVAHRAGYADQPHLTRSLKRFFGQTPARIARSANGERSS